MSKKDGLHYLFTVVTVTILSFVFFSCSSDNDEKLNDGSSNTTDVAVTSNVSKLGITYAYIDGYVNLHQVASTYQSLQNGINVGIELAMNEDFDNAKQAKSKDLEGNKLTIVIDTLSPQTKYYYRTFVKVNDLNYYGEKRSFTTKDFTNITSTGEAFEITFTSAKIKCKGDASSIDKKNNIAIGIAYSTSKTRLHPDSAIIGYNPYYGYYSKGFNETECSMDSLIKNKSFEETISRLQTGTTYYYCSFTRVGKKYKLGDIKSFSTKSSSDAQLVTGDATDITLTSATIQSTSSITSLYPKGTSIQYGIKYGTSNDTMNETTYATSSEGNKFTIHLRNLSSGKTYYYCAVVNVDGVSLIGNTKSFTTMSGDAYLFTENATNVTLTSATIKGKTSLSTLYGNNESSIRYYIRYSKNSNNINNQYGNNYESVTPQKNRNDLSATLTNLQMNTTYYYCIVANIDGYNVFSDVMNFTTKYGPDYLTTGDASDITQSSATLKGATSLSSIYPNNTSIQYSIRYATSSNNLTSSNNSTSINVSLNGTNISGKVSNLKNNTTYYYCVTAYVDGTNIYGDTKSFTTKTADTYDVLTAIAYTQSLGADVESSSDIYVKGIISSIKYTYSAQYGTATYAISVDGNAENEFTVYGSYYFDNKPWVDGNIQIQKGDKVIVCGKVVYYMGNTPEFANKKNWLVSLNGKTSDGGGDNGGGDDNGGGEVSGNTLTVVYGDLGISSLDAAITLTDGTTLTFSQEGGKNPPIYHEGTKIIRMYAQNSVTINAGSKKISSVAFAYDTYNGTAYMGNDEMYGEADGNRIKPSKDDKNVTFSGVNSSKLKVVNDFSSNSGGTQFRCTGLVITYKE